MLGSGDPIEVFDTLSDLVSRDRPGWRLNAGTPVIRPGIVDEDGWIAICLCWWGHDFTVMCRIVPGLPLIGDNVISGYATERTTSDQGPLSFAPATIGAISKKA